MSADVLVESPAQRWGRKVNSYVLPLGWLVMLTGMFCGERSLPQAVLYPAGSANLGGAAVAAGNAEKLAGNPLFIAFLVFCAYTMLSIAWSDSANSAGSLLKRPLYIAMVLLSAGMISLHAPAHLQQCVRIAATLVGIAAALYLGYFLLYQRPGCQPAGRLRGPVQPSTNRSCGALSQPYGWRTGSRQNACSTRCRWCGWRSWAPR